MGKRRDGYKGISGGILWDDRKEKVSAFQLPEITTVGHKVGHVYKYQGMIQILTSYLCFFGDPLYEKYKIKFRVLNKISASESF